MGLNVKNEEVHRPTMEVAPHTDVTFTSAVLTSFRERLARLELDNLMIALGIDITTVTPAQAHLARRETYGRFGNGNHPARLNLGDRFAYALSKARGEPLLFKGDDFRPTDVETVP